MVGIQFYSFQISVEPVSGKKVEHNGIKVELLGQIGVFPLGESSVVHNINDEKNSE